MSNKINQVEIERALDRFYTDLPSHAESISQMRLNYLRGVLSTKVFEALTSDQLLDLLVDLP